MATKPKMHTRNPYTLAVDGKNYAATVGFSRRDYTGGVVLSVEISADVNRMSLTYHETSIPLPASPESVREMEAAPVAVRRAQHDLPKGASPWDRVSDSAVERMSVILREIMACILDAEQDPQTMADEGMRHIAATRPNFNSTTSLYKALEGMISQHVVAESARRVTVDKVAVEDAQPSQSDVRQAMERLVSDALDYLLADESERYEVDLDGVALTRVRASSDAEAQALAREQVTSLFWSPNL